MRPKTEKNTSVRSGTTLIQAFHYYKFRVSGIILNLFANSNHKLYSFILEVWRRVDSYTVQHKK